MINQCEDRLFSDIQILQMDASSSTQIKICAVHLYNTVTVHIKAPVILSISSSALKHLQVMLQTQTVISEESPHVLIGPCEEQLYHDDAMFLSEGDCRAAENTSPFKTGLNERLIIDRR